MPSIRGSTYPKNGATTWSDTTKRASRKANGSLRPRTNWLWKSLSRPVAMECDLAGLGPMRARGSGPDFLFSLADAGHTFLIDVHKSFVIYEVDPQPKPGSSTKGRKPHGSISEQTRLSLIRCKANCNCLFRENSFISRSQRQISASGAEPPSASVVLRPHHLFIDRKSILL